MKYKLTNKTGIDIYIRSPEGEKILVRAGKSVIVDFKVSVSGIECVPLGRGEERKARPKSSELEKFTAIKGIGEEIAEMLLSKYGSFENFVEEVKLDDLVELPGIGEKVAKKIIEQVKG